LSPRLRIVVTGLIGQYPLGGVTWDYVQYVLGLARLGHDAYYFEDTGEWPYDPNEGGLSKRAPKFTVRYLKDVMNLFGLEERWAYRFAYDDRWFGMPANRRKEVLASADLVINVSGTLERPVAYREAAPRARFAYIDSDPVFTQVRLVRHRRFRRLVDAHDVQFTFGEALADTVPETGHLWRPTRQPVVLEEWQHAPGRRTAFTTVMNWTSYKPVNWRGLSLQQKDVEFERFLDLPGKVTPTVLEVALAEGKTRRPPHGRLSAVGWRIVDPSIVCPDPESYRNYVARSMGEWSVSKNGYVNPPSGWFSCRSACYLACGRPVILQDTGFSSVLPVGVGLLPFSSLDQAAEAIREVESNWERHSRGARAIAEQCFDSARVLDRLVAEAMDGHRPRAPLGASR
jgi:glycosyltransferase involved in cell wall biosynthesis